MALTKRTKWIIGGVVGATAIAGFIYIRKLIKDLQNFTLAFKKIKVNKFDTSNLDFDAFYDYTNNSDLKINLASQKYDIYINDVYVTSLVNNKENVLLPHATSPLAFNVKLNLKEVHEKVKLSYAKMILEPKYVLIKIEMHWKVRLGFIKIPISYTWNTNLKEILGWYIPAYRK